MLVVGPSRSGVGGLRVGAVPCAVSRRFSLFALRDGPSMSVIAAAISVNTRTIVFFRFLRFLLFSSVFFCFPGRPPPRAFSYSIHSHSHTTVSSHICVDTTSEQDCYAAACGAPAGAGEKEKKSERRSVRLTGVLVPVGVGLLPRKLPVSAGGAE